MIIGTGFQFLARKDSINNILTLLDRQKNDRDHSQPANEVTDPRWDKWHLWAIVCGYDDADGIEIDWLRNHQQRLVLVVIQDTKIEER
jgi:hypothetical protein